MSEINLSLSIPLRITNLQLQVFYLKSLKQKRKTLVRLARITAIFFIPVLKCLQKIKYTDVSNLSLIKQFRKTSKLEGILN